MSRIVLHLLVGLLSLVPAPALLAQEEDTRIVPDDHIREELGVNTYTAPAIADLFKILDALRPLDYEQWKRPLDDQAYPNRLQLAMSFGGLIAEGFFAVESEKRQDIEDIGRLLMKRATALSVGDRVTRHSKSMLTLATRGDWQGLRTELTKTQTDVENALLELRDEEIAHMIALGGWLRGLEIALKAVNADFTEAHAALLRDVDKLDYFIDRLDTLHPDVRKTPLISRLTSQLKTVRHIFTVRPATPLYPSDTTQVEKIITDLNDKLREK